MVSAGFLCRFECVTASSNTPRACVSKVRRDWHRQLCKIATLIFADHPSRVSTEMRKNRKKVPMPKTPKKVKKHSSGFRNWIDDKESALFPFGLRHFQSLFMDTQISLSVRVRRGGRKEPGRRGAEHSEKVIMQIDTIFQAQRISK